MRTWVWTVLGVFWNWWVWAELGRPYEALSSDAPHPTSGGHGRQGQWGPEAIRPV